MTTRLPMSSDAAVRIVCVLICVALVLRYWRPTPKASIPSTTPVMASLGLDHHTLSNGLFAIGISGSGKTTMLKLLIPEVLRDKSVGGLFLAVKRDALADNIWMFGKAGRKDVKVFQPGVTQCNIAGFILEHWGPVELGNMLDLAYQALPSSSGKKSEAYWQTLFTEGLIHMCTVVNIAIEQPTLVHLYNFISSAPTKTGEMQTEAFKETYFYKVTAKAEANAGEHEKHDVQNAINFFASIVKSGEKSVGAVVNSITGLLAPMVRGKLRASVHCNEGNFLPSDPAVKGELLTFANSVLEHGDSARLFQALFHTAFLRYQLSNEPLRFVLKVADEVQEISNGKYDSQVIQQLRSTRTGTINLSQSLPVLVQAQDDAMMGKQIVQAWVTGCATQLFLNTNEGDTIEWISKLSGEYRAIMIGGGGGDGDPRTFDPIGVGGGQGLSFHQQFRPRITSTDMLTLRRGSPMENGCVDMYVFQAGRMFWHTTLQREQDNG